MQRFNTVSLSVTLFFLLNNYEIGVTKGYYGYVCEECSSEIDLEKAADIPWRDASARGHASSWQPFHPCLIATLVCVAVVL